MIGDTDWKVSGGACLCERAYDMQTDANRQTGAHS
jgi:hypothetical protein